MAFEDEKMFGDRRSVDKRRVRNFDQKSAKPSGAPQKLLEEIEEEQRQEILRLELRIAELQEEFDELNTTGSSKRRERVKKEIADYRKKINELKQEV